MIVDIKIIGPDYTFTVQRERWEVVKAIGDPYTATDGIGAGNLTQYVLARRESDGLEAE
jgi:hypothetical protein